MTDLRRYTPISRRAWRMLVSVLAALGAAFVVLFVVGFAFDFRAVDRTQGGYEPPYQGWTGTPTDWSLADVSPTGLVMRGYVSNALINCTTGMLSFQIYGRTLDYRTVSPRALVIHKPREACAERGFSPEF